MQLNNLLNFFCIRYFREKGNLKGIFFLLLNIIIDMSQLQKKI